MTRIIKWHMTNAKPSWTGQAHGWKPGKMQKRRVECQPATRSYQSFHQFHSFTHLVKFVFIPKKYSTSKPPFFGLGCVSLLACTNDRCQHPPSFASSPPKILLICIPISWLPAVFGMLFFFFVSHNFIACINSGKSKGGEGGGGLLGIIRIPMDFFCRRIIILCQSEWGGRKRRGQLLACLMFFQPSSLLVFFQFNEIPVYANLCGECS